ncbi:MAG: hypothetical protein MUE97_02095 [Phycisphaerales bacterium]|nr:hypothetical protein [Phycisphaerales bacterium]
MPTNFAANPPSAPSPVRVATEPAGAPPKPPAPPLPPSVPEDGEPPSVDGAGGNGQSEAVFDAPANGRRRALRSTVSRFPCARCGAKLEFAPGTTALVCPYCQHRNELAPAAEAGGQHASDSPYAPGVEELDFSEYIQQRQSEATTDELPTVHCDSCGADVQPPPNITSLACPYCSANIVLTGACTRAIKPNCILPFVLTRDQAIGQFRQWLASRWFAPNALKRQGKLDSAVQGLYVPHWTYDAFTRTRYTGYRGEAYYVTVRTGNTTTRQRRIRWYPASGVVDVRFDDLLVCASKTLTPKQATDIAPWDLKAVVPYRDEYLAGFVAERYQVDLAEGFVNAQQQMAGPIDGAIRSDIGGDEQRISSRRIHYSDITFKHLLAPVWITAYRYNNRVFNILVNARTGEVIGQRPYSFWKITGFVLLCIAVLVIVILLLNAR